MLTIIGINFSSSVMPSDTGARKLTSQTQFKLQLKLFRNLTERISLSKHKNSEGKSNIF